MSSKLGSWDPFPWDVLWGNGREVLRFPGQKGLHDGSKYTVYRGRVYGEGRDLTLGEDFTDLGTSQVNRQETRHCRGRFGGD